MPSVCLRLLDVSISVLSAIVAEVRWTSWFILARECSILPLYCRFPSYIIGGRQGSQEPRLASILKRMLGPELGQCLGENRFYFKDSYVSDKVVHTFLFR